jgi:hypothetical protein
MSDATATDSPIRYEQPAIVRRELVVALLGTAQRSDLDV